MASSLPPYFSFAARKAKRAPSLIGERKNKSELVQIVRAQGGWASHAARGTGFFLLAVGKKPLSDGREVKREKREG